MTTAQTPFILKLTKHLHWIEKFFLVLIVASALLFLMDLNVESLMMLSLSGLATVFFLYAQRPPEVKSEHTSPMDFKELLTLSILPKVLWISASVSMIGILFFLLGLKGFEQMLIIGASSLVLAMFLLALLFIGGGRHLSALTPVLLRAVPVLLIDIYILVQ